MKPCTNAYLTFKSQSPVALVFSLPMTIWPWLIHKCVLVSFLGPGLVKPRSEEVIMSISLGQARAKSETSPLQVGAPKTQRTVCRRAVGGLPGRTSVEPPLFFLLGRVVFLCFFLFVFLLFSSCVFLFFPGNPFV